MPRVVLVLSLLLALASCSERCGKSDGSTQVTPSSSADASQPIVDEDYQFRLERPGPDWKLLDEENIRNLNADAVAGMVDKSGRFVIVIPEEVPGVDMEAYADLVVNGMQLVDKTIEARSPATHQGHEAYRLTFRGKSGGADLRFADLLVRHGDFAFQFLAWASASHPKSSAEDLYALASSFILLDGEPKGRRSVGAAIETADGPGWRVREGVFESAVSRMRIAPPEGWQVLVGLPLDTMNQDAEVGLRHIGPDVYMVVLVDKAARAPAARRAEEQRLLADTKLNLGAEGEGTPFEATLMGKPHKLEVLTTSDMFEYVYGVLPHQDMTLQVLGWYAKPLRDEAQKELQRALASITELPEAAVAALRVQLEAAAPTANVVGETFSLRRGTYRNFARNLTWTQPDGMWTVEAGDAARLVNQDAELYVHDKSRGIHALLITEDAADFTPETFEQTLTDHMGVSSGFRPGPSTVKASFAGAPTRLVQGPATQMPPIHQLLATTVHGGHAVQMLIWGHGEHLTEHRDDLSELIAGLHFESAMPPVTRQGDRHQDHRMGYSLDVPHGWTNHQLPFPSQSSAGYAAWKNGSSVAIVLAICVLDESQNEEWFKGFIDQMMRDQLGTTVRGKPTETAARLGSEAATRVSWVSLGERADAIYATRDRTLVAMLVTGRNSKAFDEMVASFRFED